MLSVSPISVYSELITPSLLGKKSSIVMRFIMTLFPTFHYFFILTAFSSHTLSIYYPHLCGRIIITRVHRHMYLYLQL